jgi:hypothetical protein
MINAGGGKGCNDSTALKLNGKIRTRFSSILLLTPPQELAQTKHRQRCLRPLDEFFAFGLGKAMVIAPVGASGYQHYGVVKIDTTIITWQEGND